MYLRRIAAAAAAAFRGGRGATRIVEATISRCMLEGSTFVLTVFRDVPRKVLKIRDTHH